MYQEPERDGTKVLHKETRWTVASDYIGHRIMSDNANYWLCRPWTEVDGYQSDRGMCQSHKKRMVENEQ